MALLIGWLVGGSVGQQHVFEVRPSRPADVAKPLFAETLQMLPDPVELFESQLSEHFDAEACAGD
jgi:hypothetical protein